MHKISSSRNCTYAIFDDEHGQITQPFFATISRIITSSAAVPVEIKLMCEQTVVLRSIGTPGVSYYISDDDKAAIMWTNAHLGGTATNIIAYLGGVIHPKDLPQLLTVDVKYGGNVLSDKVDVQLVVKEGSDGSREVAAEIVRMEAVKIIAGITAEDKRDWEQLRAAAGDLRERWTKLMDSKCGRQAHEAGLTSRLAGEMREMELRLYNNYYWLEYMLSWQSHQQCQQPLPQPFMHNQSTNDPLLQLRILAKAQGKITERQQGLPVMVRVMASDAGLAMVERASIDLVLVIDASDPVKEREMKTRKRLHLLSKASEMEKEHNKVRNVVDELEESLNTIIKAKEDIEEQLVLLIKYKEMEKEPDKTNNIVVELKESLKMLIKANRMNGLRYQAMELEKDLDKVMKHTEEQLGLAMKVKNMVVEFEESLNKMVEMEVEITQKRQMDNMALEMIEIRSQTMELEKDVDEVMKNTEERLGLLIKARQMKEGENMLVKHELLINFEEEEEEEEEETTSKTWLGQTQRERGENKLPELVLERSQRGPKMILIRHGVNTRNEMTKLRYQAMELEENVDKVMKNIEGKLGLFKAKEMVFEKFAYKVMKDIEERLGLVIAAKDMEEYMYINKAQKISEEYYSNKAKMMEQYYSSKAKNKAKNMVVEFEESLKLLIKEKEEKENERMEMEGEITPKRQEVNRMSIEMEGLRYHATELEKDVDRLGLLTKAIELVMDKLSVTDRLAIVPVQSYVTEPATGLFEMSKQGRIETSSKVQKLSMALTDNKAAQVLRDKRPRYCKVQFHCIHTFHWKKRKFQR
jgi:hypothetical protein